MTRLHPDAATKPSAAPSSHRFSNHHLPAHERVPFVKDIVGRHLLHVDVDPLSDAPFHHQAVFHGLPGLKVASVTCSAVRSTRTRELIARGGADEVILIVPTGGLVDLTWIGRETSAARGEAALLPGDEPGSTAWSGLSHVLFYGVPVDLLKPLVPNVGDSLFRRVPSTSAALGLLVGYTEVMLRSEATATPDLCQAAGAHLRDLIALALGATRDGTAMAEEGGLRTARLQTIKAEIARNPAAPGLDVGTVAKRHGLSPRTVQMLFEGEDLTFSQYVLEQRLMLAHRALSNGVGGHRTITEIALDSGFSEISYFNRAFRRRFGASPSELRARHLN